MAQRLLALADLPEWDLSDLYPGSRQRSAEARSQPGSADDAEAFRERYQGRLADLSGAALGAAIETYERLQEQSGRIISYASLVHAGDLVDPEIGRFFQTMQERINAVSTTLLFFTLELNKLDDADLETKETDPALARYRPWLRDTRAFRPYQLSDEIEKLLHEKYVAGRAAWTRLFDETIADLRFPIGGNELTEAEALNLLSDRNSEIRREAALVIGDVLGEECENLCADHQHAGQGQGDRRPLARFCAPDLLAQPGELCRGRRRRRTDRGGPRQLSTLGAPLLRAQGELVWGRSSCRSGTVMRRYLRTRTARSPGPRPVRPCCRPMALLA